MRDKLFRLLTAFVFIIASLSIQTSAQEVRGGKTKASPGALKTGSLESNESQGLRVYAFRLLPKQDLRKQIELFAKEQKIQAGLILTAVGSLQKATLRLADQKDPTTFEGKHEIVSLVGTIAPDGVHLHISLSDSTGKTIGGHLVEGCEVYTTVEIVLADALGLRFTREQDAQTGYKELKVHKIPRANRRSR